jgi:hypothetical protein
MESRSKTDGVPAIAVESYVAKTTYPARLNAIFRAF